ncbi:MAG: PDZ domain-containing protein [Acidobacteriota bacterium]|nr:PDZ domain-containing protein [Acidobacteriota bacterium]
MKTRKTIIGFSAVIGLVLVVGLNGLETAAQTTRPPSAPAPQQRKTIVPARRPNAVIVENGPAAPQVVTILHRLNGLKVFRLLLRSREQVGAIANLDEDFQITSEVHTNVIAGLALDDGRTIAAWLPEAEAEIPPPTFPLAPKAPGLPPDTSPSTTQAPVAARVSKSIPGFPLAPFGENLLEPADLKIITRDGQRLSGRYIGLDRLTGLSVITLTNGLPGIVDSKEEAISVGQRVRLIGPEPAANSEPGARTAMYVRLGETEAAVIDVNRSPAGGLARVRIKSAKLSPANIGGIAINESGETLGIVDAVEGGEATIVPVALVRSAAKRVMARQASVPRPWLGIHGEPIGTLSFERILRGGWEPKRARALAEKRQGIFLTSVAPGSPAALGQLRPGDVILRVNKEDVRNADDFSWLLEEAGPGSSISFTVARPDRLAAQVLDLTLSESPDPFFGLREFEAFGPKGFGPGLMAQGIETIAIMPKVAMRFGANGGLLVVSVSPTTAAFKAGLRPGDVIEAIDGQRLSGLPPLTLFNRSGASSTLSIVRNKRKLQLLIPASEQ